MSDKFFEDITTDLDEIARRLASPDAAERRVAVLDLVEAAEQGAERLLIAALSDADASVRRESAKGLDQFDGLATARALAGALLDADGSVAAMAAQSLAELKSQEAAPPLLALIRS
jgi:HEAT repeat protein